MGQKKKITLAAGPPLCLKPLDSCKFINMYIITRCIEDTHDKIYIFLVVSKKKKKYLARFWGKYGGSLSAMYTNYDQDEFQRLINEKGAEGYAIVDNDEIVEDDHVYGAYADVILVYVKLMASPGLLPGTKTSLT